MAFSNPIRSWTWVLAACVAGLLAVLAFAPVAEAQTTGGLSGKKIVLDPGHGSSDSGATQKTANGTLLVEKEQNLIVANKLKDLLEASGATVS